MDSLKYRNEDAQFRPLAIDMKLSLKNCKKKIIGFLTFKDWLSIYLPFSDPSDYRIKVHERPNGTSKVRLKWPPLSIFGQSLEEIAPYLLGNNYIARKKHDEIYEQWGPITPRLAMEMPRTDYEEQNPRLENNNLEVLHESRIFVGRVAEEIGERAFVMSPKECLSDLKGW